MNIENYKAGFSKQKDTVEWNTFHDDIYLLTSCQTMISQKHTEKDSF